MEDKLSDFLKSGKDWERKATSISGLFVLKMPAYRSTPTRLAVELNPVDSEGRPSKKRGVLLRSTEELSEYLKILNDERITKLLKRIETINPKPGGKDDKKKDIIEI